MYVPSALRYACARRATSRLYTPANTVLRDRLSTVSVPHACMMLSMPFLALLKTPALCMLSTISEEAGISPNWLKRPLPIPRISSRPPMTLRSPRGMSDWVCFLIRGAMSWFHEISSPLASLLRTGAKISSTSPI